MTPPHPAAETTQTDGGPDHSQDASEAPVTELILMMDCRSPLSRPVRVSFAELDELTLGRGDTRDAEFDVRAGSRNLRFSVPDGAVSSTHATLKRSDGHWIVEDQSSKNGTFYNGVQVQRCSLAVGDILRLGHTFFRISEGAPGATIMDLSDVATCEMPFATLDSNLADRFQELSRVAATRIPVLLLGESGVGKEVVARAVHERSQRPGALIAVNCGAIPEHLVESELFGVRRGAYSGAHENRRGHVRAADRGTLFLDEVGDLPLRSQSAFLRVVQEGEVTPLGSSCTIATDFRLVSATLHDLLPQIRAGSFREDLYRRLSGYSLTLPPLRFRMADIGLFIAALIPRVADERAHEVRFDHRAALALLTHDWPGNIRELEHALTRAWAVCRGSQIGLDHLPPEIRTTSQRRPFRGDVRANLIQLLERNAGNLSRVAKAMSTSRPQVRRLLQRYDIDVSTYRR